MIRLQRAVDMSRFRNWKNSGLPPTTKLPLLLLCIANVTIPKETKGFCLLLLFFLISTSSFVLNFVCFRAIIIARNRGHFEPANNYQRYIISHSATIEYQEDSIWRRSRLDLQRSVFCTMTYTIWAPQIFYLMKRKRKEDLQVNLWYFSRQSDDMMSEFWFAFIKFSRQDYWICIQRLVYFYSSKDLRTHLFPGKNINKYGRRFEDQRCSYLTISVIVFNTASRHLLNMEIRQVI